MANSQEALRGVHACIMGSMPSAMQLSYTCVRLEPCSSKSYFLTRHIRRIAQQALAFPPWASLFWNISPADVQLGADSPCYN